MTDQEKLIDKLRKIHAHARSAKEIGNEAEAQAFATMLQTLLAKHKLDASQIEWEEQLNEELVRRIANPMQGSYAAWELELANTVAKASCCRAFFNANGRKKVTARVQGVCFYGTKTDTEGAQAAFMYLQEAAKHLAEREYVTYFYKCKEEGDVRRARGYKAAWLLGFVTRLAERYRQNDLAIKSSVAGTAIIRISQALARVNEFKAKVVVVDGPSIDNEQGYRDGQKAAARVRLTNDPKAAEGQLHG